MTIKKILLATLVCLGASAWGWTSDPFPLAIATMDYPQVHSIMDGTVKIPECQISYSTRTFTGLDRLMDHDAAGDVIEVDFIPYLQKFSSETVHDWVLVPVFLWREFPHRHLSVLSDKAILSVNELAGKTVGVDSPSKTMEVWTRGIIASSATNTADYITWNPDIISSTAPRRRVFTDFKTAEQAYFQRTRIFPIMTVLALRRELAEANPWLPEALFLAFSEAKDRAIEAGTMPLPWGIEAKDETVALMKKNYWSYGIKNNPKTLADLFKFAKQQGLIKEDLKPEDVFAPETLDLIDEKEPKIDAR